MNGVVFFVGVFLLVLKKINDSSVHLSRCISTSPAEMTVVSGEVVLQHFSVLQVAFLLWLVRIMSWSSFSMTFTLFCRLSSTSPPGWTVGREGLIPWSCWGERRVPCLCCFSCAARGCQAGYCWLQSLVVDLLSSSFLQSLFQTLCQLAGESSPRPVGLAHSKRCWILLLSLPFQARWSEVSCSVMKVIFSKQHSQACSAGSNPSSCTGLSEVICECFE